MSRTQVITGLSSFHTIARNRDGNISTDTLVSVVDQFSDLRQREADLGQQLPDSEWASLGSVVTGILAKVATTGIQGMALGVVR